MSLDAQNAKSLAITEGDVKTIHDGDNRLLWGKVMYNTKYNGDIFQQTYTGKNLVNFTTIAFDGTNSGSGTRDGETFTVTSTTNSFGGIYMAQNGLVLEPNTTYTFSAKVVSTTTTNGSSVYILSSMNNSGANIAGNLATAGNITSATFTTPSTIPSDARIALYVRQQNSTTVFTNLQMEKSSSVTSYEPYVGGIPSPNPEYPQGIDITKARQTVTLTGGSVSKDYTINLSSKNLFNKNETDVTSEHCTYTYDDGVYTVRCSDSSDPSLTIYMYLPAGTYTLNSDAYLSANTQIVNGTTVLADLSSNYEAQTFTITGYATGIKFNWPRTDDPIVLGLNTLQVEEGSEATSYTNYFEKIELWKVGNYQDYIWKDGGTWKVHKVVGKVELDGSNDEDWAITNTGTPSFFYRFREIENLGGGSGTIFGLCNIASPNTISSSNTLQGYCFVVAAHNDIRLRYGTEQTITEWRSFLASEPLIAYYPLATPSDTVITDTTLISQLESVKEWCDRAGYESTVTSVSPNLPIIIDRVAL